MQPPSKFRVFETLESRHVFATFTVDSLFDSVDPNDGYFTLREAVQAANETREELHTITFMEGLTGSILLQDERMRITSPVRILGPGVDKLTIDASSMDPTPGEFNSDGVHVFDFRMRYTSDTYEISDLTITGSDGRYSAVSDIRGSQGLIRRVRFVKNGGALGGANLRIEDSSFEFNVDGVGARNATILRSEFHNNWSSFRGGALGVRGALEIRDSIFADNWAGSDGGAISMTADTDSDFALIVNTTFSGNSTNDPTAGDVASGGAIVSREYTSFRILNSTFSGNRINGTGTGGAIHFRGPATLEISNSTIVDNAGNGIGGVEVESGSLLLRNSIVARNAGQDIRAATKATYSLIGNSTGTGYVATNGQPDANGNQIGSSNQPLEPFLGVLRDNGGIVPTRLPRSISPAINSGDPNFDDTTADGRFDQRGQPYRRVVGGRIDIGAVETTSFQDGDIDGNGVISVADIDRFCQAIRSNQVGDFDWNEDGFLDTADLREMTRRLGSTAGDANLDYVFDSTDFILVFQAAQYEDSLPLNSSWATGDWNCDGEFNSADFIEAFQSGSYQQQALPWQANRDIAASLHFIHNGSKHR
ncbi:MAG: choice-of-anchor Q domain-containing protein [Pirellulaceae bacterium]